MFMGTEDDPEALLHNETCSADNTVAIGIPIPTPDWVPAKFNATAACVPASTTGEPESPGWLITVYGAVGEYMIILLNFPTPHP